MSDAEMLVGLEIHQQLNVGKLFCKCTGTAKPGHIEEFSRMLRPVKSEMGGYDPAALFEAAQNKTITYHADTANSCLVERDEEPPHGINPAALKTALVVASALKSHIFEEIYTMRKTVIDGSNTTGFQRTMLISQGGTLEAAGRSVGVQSICLEEDSARILPSNGSQKHYALDRLGIPLIEIALEPVEGEPREIRHIAEALGRLLRSTGMAARGIGTIRQDVNVSVRGGGGIVEIKGVQQLDQLEKVIEYERVRQQGMVTITSHIRDVGVPTITGSDTHDVTDLMTCCDSDTIRRALDMGHVVWAIPLKGLAGILGYEPQPDVRLGRELGQLVKFYGIGGVFHSDELPGYGITDTDVGALRNAISLQKQDAFVLVAGPADSAVYACESIMRRVSAAYKGVPAETRLATAAGHTRFMRPRPGAARMYPETDVPPVIISRADLQDAATCIPEPWEKTVSDAAGRYGITTQLAEQVLDSEYREIFMDVVGSTSIPAPFVASSLCSTITSLAREGLDRTLLTDDTILEVFAMLDERRISKEAIRIIFSDIMSGHTLQDALQKVRGADAEEISSILNHIVSDNRKMILSQGSRAVGPLMGPAMKQLRGRASGQFINKMLIEKINQLCGES